MTDMTDMTDITVIDSYDSDCVHGIKFLDQFVEPTKSHDETNAKSVELG